MRERKPLTLEELREMNGKPVWIDFTGSIVKRPAGWFILKNIQDEEAYLVGDVNIYKALEYYGTKWRAYSSAPSRLDRSAWEPCAKCRSCLSCSHVVESARDSRNACFWCDHMNQFKPMNFCPSCGRPLTDAAWEMLKNRLEINK